MNNTNNENSFNLGFNEEDFKQSNKIFNNVFKNEINKEKQDYLNKK